jgi:hypothetical protein
MNDSFLPSNFLIELKSETTTNALFDMINKRKEPLLEQMASIIPKRLVYRKGNKPYNFLLKLVKEKNSKDSNKKGSVTDSSTSQLRGNVGMKPAGELPSGSIRSIPHPLAGGSKKGQQRTQKVNAYHANIAEGSDGNHVMNLLLDYDLKRTRKREADFLGEAGVQTEKGVPGRETTERVEQGIPHGGNDSKANRPSTSRPEQSSRPMTIWKVEKCRDRIEKKDEGFEAASGFYSVFQAPYP